MDDDLYDGMGAAAASAGVAAASAGGAGPKGDVAVLQAELAATRRALSAWEDAFRDDPCCADAPLAPATVLDALLALRGAERDAREASREAGRRTAALEARADAADAEASELRTLLHAAAGPCCVPPARQASTLMLDPGTARELRRLTAALEAARETIKQKEEEILTNGFSKESKQGRLLMARFRTLSRENEEFGLQVSQGRLHALQTEITLLREQVSALKRQHAELLASSAALSAENDALQMRCLGAGAALPAKEADGAPPAPAEAEEGGEAAAAPGGRGKRARRGD